MIRAMNEHIDLMHRHRSIRTYQDETISEEHIRAAVAAGQMASSSSNVQAYSLIRITDEGEREKLVELTGGQNQVAQAGAFFVVCGDTMRHRICCERTGRDYVSSLERFLVSALDAALFSQNLVLAFESLGYGICYIGGLRNKLEEVTKLLEIPSGVYPFYGLCVGISDESPSLRPRLPLDLVYFQDRYPDEKAILGRLEAYDEKIASYYHQRGEDRPAWSTRMAELFSTSRRADLGTYYRSQGANFD